MGCSITCRTDSSILRERTMSLSSNTPCISSSLYLAVWTHSLISAVFHSLSHLNTWRCRGWKKNHMWTLWNVKRRTVWMNFGGCGRGKEDVRERRGEKSSRGWWMFPLFLVIHLSETSPWIRNDFVLSVSIDGGLTIDGIELDNLTQNCQKRGNHCSDWCFSFVPLICFGLVSMWCNPSYTWWTCFVLLYLLIDSGI